MLHRHGADPLRERLKVCWRLIADALLAVAGGAWILTVGGCLNTVSGHPRI
jgi:hypothetical protein